MKKSLLALTMLTGLITTTGAFAALDGAYIGGAMGWGDIHQKGLTDFSTNNGSDSDGVAGRVFAGYKFNKNIALESGFTKFSNFNPTGSDSDPFAGTVNVNGTIKSYALDLVVKGILPLQQGISLFATAGAAYLNETASVSYNMASAYYNYSGRGKESANAVLPTFGLGASYDLTNNLAAEVSWSHIQVLDNTTSNLANTDFVGAGLSYHFG